MLRARRKNYVNINREPSKPTLQINYITELMKYYTIAAFSIETLKTMDMIATLPSSDQSTACVCVDVCMFMHEKTVSKRFFQLTILVFLF